MSTTPYTSHALTDGDRRKLFVMSVVALVSAGIAFSVRTNVLGDLAHDLFHGPGGEKVGGAVGNAFLGFAISIVLSSPLIDRVGMKALLVLSSTLITIGTLGVIFVQTLGHGDAILFTLGASFLVFGLGWGLIESVINPLIATVYSDNKTKKLNHLHAWWPAGLMIGGLFGFFAGDAHISWRIQVAVTLIPTIAFGLGAATLRFPVTERTAAGIDDKAMWKELAQPLFILMWLCMFLTAASELAPGQWVSFALSQSVGMNAILILVYTSAIAFVGRHFAGPMVHKLSPMGLLWVSVVLASIGLTMLGHADSKLSAMVAATVWGLGVCFLWPTMLATTSERFPRGGSLLMGLMGGAGMGSIFLVLPQLGNIYDKTAQATAIASGYPSFAALKAAATASPAAAPSVADAYNHAQAVAGSHSFLALAVLPAILIVVFGAVYLSDKARGGYRVVSLQSGTPISEREGVEA